LDAYFSRAIAWSQAAEKGSYRLLDTFLSDAISVDLLASIFSLSSSAHPAKILIVDPRSDFALARAKSIGQIAAREVRAGICNVLTAIGRVTDVNPLYLPTSSFEELLSLLHSHAHRVSLEVRFYSEVPSGPLYFLRDLLLAGRFCAGVSSSKLPWTMIVDDPNYFGDLYDVYSDEFERIWSKALPNPEPRALPSESTAAERPFYDLAVITATEVEWMALKELPGVMWQKLSPSSTGGLIAYGADFEGAGRKLSVIATRQADPGMVCAAITTTKLLQHMSVKFLAVVGICATDPSKASLGSIVVASQVFDAQAGKFVGGRLQPNMDSVTLDLGLIDMIKDQAWTYVKEAEAACAHLRPPQSKRFQVKVAYGKVATIGHVVADSVFAERIWNQSRQCVALDMESYGVFRASEEITISERRPRSLFIKTAVDFADQRKNDRYQQFGAALSAHFLRSFALANLAQ
jgi:nucleoside phosphorylase